MFVYVLRSLKDSKRYVGLSRSVEHRLTQHNRGEVRATRRRRPFELRYSEEFGTLIEARHREKYFKTAAGRRFLDKLGV
jgi:putative endonuclease